MCDSAKYSRPRGASTQRREIGLVLLERKATTEAPATVGKTIRLVAPRGSASKHLLQKTMGPFAQKNHDIRAGTNHHTE